MIRRYCTHWLRFKVKGIFRPRISKTPAASKRWSVDFHPYGFILWSPGKRRSYSWRNWVEGPCNYATYKRLRR